MTSHTDLSATLDLLAATVPAFVPDGDPFTTGKAVLVPGHLHAVPAIAKHLVDPAPIWRSHFAREATALTAFTSVVAGGAPVRAPALLAHHPHQWLLVMERVPGRPLSAHRHLESALPEATTHAVLTELTSLQDWRPPATGLEALPPLDYRARIDRYTRHHTILTPDDAERLLALTDRLGAPACLAHGDLIPANVLTHSHSDQVEVRLIDWEYTGFYHPGYDLALLWITAGAAPATRQAIGRLVESRRETGAFLANLMVLLAREIRMHQPHAHQRWAHDRLQRLRTDLTEARRTLAEGTST